MKVTFTKEGPRRYSVYVSRERYVDLRCGSIGYDDWLPHDLLHFVAEAEFGLDGAIFGDLASGGNARIFVDQHSSYGTNPPHDACKDTETPIGIYIGHP